MIPTMIRYASQMHGSQKRKRTGQPYFRHHCLGLLEDVCNDPVYGDDENAQLIILGHDIVEDCTDKESDKERNILYAQIQDIFNLSVSNGIQELTNEFTKKRHPKMNRRERKAAELKRLSKISDRGKFLKLCDRRANLQDMVDEEDWNATYARESWDMAWRLSNDMQIAIQVMTLATRIRDASSK